MKKYDKFFEVADIMMDIAMMLKGYADKGPFEKFTPHKITDVVYNMIKFKFGENAAECIDKDKAVTILRADVDNIAKRYYQIVFCKVDDDSDECAEIMYKTFEFYNYEQENIVIMLPKPLGIYTKDQELCVGNSIFRVIDSLISYASDIDVKTMPDFLYIERYKAAYVVYLIAGLYLFLMKDVEQASKEFYALPNVSKSAKLNIPANMKLRESAFEKILNFEIDPLNFKSDMVDLLSSVLLQNDIF